MFRLTIKTDNDAFSDHGEVSRILRELADRLDTPGTYGPRTLFDVNGNAVGVAEFDLRPKRKHKARA